MENSAKLNEKDVFDIRETSLLRYVLQNVNGERENCERSQRAMPNLSKFRRSAGNRRGGWMRSIVQRRDADAYGMIFRILAIPYDACQCLRRWMRIHQIPRYEGTWSSECTGEENIQKLWWK